MARTAGACAYGVATAAARSVAEVLRRWTRALAVCPATRSPSVARGGVRTLGLLVAAAALSYFVGEGTDAKIIGLIVALSVGLGFVNERHCSSRLAQGRQRGGDAHSCPPDVEEPRADMLAGTAGVTSAVHVGVRLCLMDVARLSDGDEREMASTEVQLTYSNPEVAPDVIHGLVQRAYARLTPAKVHN